MTHEEQFRFNDDVSLQYQIYNGLFLTLPFSDLERVGALLPVFSERCERMLSEGAQPTKIVEDFFSDVLKEDKPQRRMAYLFLFLQLIERQVVLFDAIEETVKPKTEVLKLNHARALSLEEKRSVRIVLTAHPTQFYPETVLGVIEDLSQALSLSDFAAVRELLLQLGRTSFSNMKPPTPLSEADNLINRYIPILQEVFTELTQKLRVQTKNPPRIELGFWPGGDRDGHVAVTTDTTIEVAEMLRQASLEFYLRKLKLFRRRATFKGVIDDLNDIYSRLRKTRKARDSKKDTLKSYETPHAFKSDLEAVLLKINKENGGLFADRLEELITAVDLFGFHTASLDLRQSSNVHEAVLLNAFEGYASLDTNEKMKLLSRSPSKKTLACLDGVQGDTMRLLSEVGKIQRRNGSKGLHRYIVSHTETSAHLLEVLALYRLAEPSESLCPLDIVPLFESINSLHEAEEILAGCWANKRYRDHLKTRSNIQHVMLGFSDGTKDGGYAACNIAIHQCKSKLQALAQKNGVEIIFFDGRGGPAARGGGNTHRYYKAVKERIALHDIQLTVQGQTISSHYGTTRAAKENMSLLLNALIETPRKSALQNDKLLEQLSQLSRQSYLALRNNPLFVPFMEEATPLWGFGLLNNASRPPRKSSGVMTLEDLRAIPFVGAWAQMKLNIPGYFGLGSALETLCANGEEANLKTLYKENLFFQTLLDNAMQALRKSFLPLTRYLESDKKFGQLVMEIRNETKRSIKWILRIAEQSKLLEADPRSEASIANREKLILPLLVIQHCALQKLRHLKKGEERKVWEKLLLKSIPANINAGRNSA